VRESNIRQSETGVDVLLDEVDVAEQLPEALQGVVLALDRHDQLLGRGHGVDSEEPEGRRAVQEDEVIRRPAHVLERPLEPSLAGELTDELDLGAGEVDGGGHRVEPLDLRRNHGILQRCLAEQHVVHRRVAGLVADPEPGGGVALGIEVDDQDAMAKLGQRGAEAHGRGALADPALLVRDRDDARGRALRRRRGGAGPAGARRLRRGG
jgi:hypothetical protein